MMPKPKNEPSLAEIMARVNGTKETPIKPLNPDSPASVNLINQLREFLKDRYPIRRNMVTRYLELHGKEVDTVELNSIYIEAKEIMGNKLSFDLVERLINSNFTPSFNPIRDFFESNAHKKPVGLIKQLAESINSYSGFDDKNFYPAYKEEFIRRWLVGLVSSVYGQHSPLLLVLSGGINSGKTEFFRQLLPDCLQRFYAESRLDAGKDDEILMCQKLIIMDDEFGGKSKKLNEKLKELTSKQNFTLREPYGKKNVTLQRLAVLCGTSNETQILSDPTGNRRIIPVQVESFNFEMYNSINKTELLMEAYHLWKGGYKWQLTREDIILLNENSVGFEEVSTEADLIQEYFALPTATDLDIQKRTPSWIMAWIFKKDGSRLDKRKFMHAMRKAGFEYKMYKVGSEVIRGFAFVLKNEQTATIAT